MTESWNDEFRVEVSHNFCVGRFGRSEDEGIWRRFVRQSMAYPVRCRKSHSPEVENSSPVHIFILLLHCDVKICHVTAIAWCRFDRLRSNLFWLTISYEFSVGCWTIAFALVTYTEFPRLFIIAIVIHISERIWCGCVYASAACSRLPIIVRFTSSQTSGQLCLHN